MLVWAFDPGDTSTGFAEGTVSKYGIKINRTATMLRPQVLDELQVLSFDMPEPKVDLFVVERYQLYPWMARQQGFSEFETPQLIGVIKYIASLLHIPVVMQTASVKKKGRSLAWDHGVRPMDTRSLGSGKGAYKGPDFGKLRGNGMTQHERDALAHLYYWALTSKGSPWVAGVAPEEQPC